MESTQGRNSSIELVKTYENCRFQYYAILHDIIFFAVLIKQGAQGSTFEYSTVINTSKVISTAQPHLPSGTRPSLYMQQTSNVTSFLSFPASGG